MQDLFSRCIVGWSMADHMCAELVVDALEMAVAARRPGAGVIHHSDQGSQTEFKGSSQYISLALGKMCVENGIAKSMAAAETVSTTPSRRRCSRR